MSTSVASVTKFFPTAQNGFTTTLASTISSGATTVPLNSVAGYTNGDTAVFVVDPSSVTLKQTFTGVIDTGGVQVTGVIWTAGTNAAHSAGATVVDYATATHISMMTKGLLVSHNQAGTMITDLPLTTPKITTSIKDSSGNTVIPMLGSSSTTSIKLSTTAVGPSYIESGCVITADSAGVNKNWSMTAGVVYINGVRNTVAAITASVATASKDTYVDLLDAGTSVATAVITGGNIVNNNAASPALAASSIRIGIICCGASSIAAATSINQGEADRVLPIASSVPYSVTDSLGNLISNRTPNPTLIGYRQRITDFTTTATSATQITELSCPVIIPAGRKVKVIMYSGNIYNSGANATRVTMWDGTVGSGTRLQFTSMSSSSPVPADLESAPQQPSLSAATSKTYNGGLHVSAGTGTWQGDTATFGPSFIEVRLV